MMRIVANDGMPRSGEPRHYRLVRGIREYYVKEYSKKP